MGTRELLSEEDIGVGGGARRPVARRDARVEPRDLAGVGEADRGCASQCSHPFASAAGRRPSWRPPGVRELLVIHEWRVANAAQIIPLMKTTQLTIRATVALNHTSYHLVLGLLDARRLLGKVSGT